METSSSQSQLRAGVHVSIHRYPITIYLFSFSPPFVRCKEASNITDVRSRSHEFPSHAAELKPAAWRPSCRFSCLKVDSCFSFCPCSVFTGIYVQMRGVVVQVTTASCSVSSLLSHPHTMTKGFANRTQEAHVPPRSSQRLPVLSSFRKQISSGGNSGGS